MRGQRIFLFRHIHFSINGSILEVFCKYHFMMYKNFNTVLNQQQSQFLSYRMVMDTASTVSGWTDSKYLSSYIYVISIIFKSIGNSGDQLTNLAEPAHDSLAH